MQARPWREWYVHRAKTIAVLLCVLVTTITFMRFLVTPLGLESLGRHWGYFVNYFEFGFIRRGLVGTLLYPFIPSPIHNDYLPLLILFPLFLLAVLVVALRYASTLGFLSPQREIFLSLLILSPALLPHYAYSTGDFNVLLALIYFASLLLIRWPAPLFLLMAVAMLVHEIFLLAFVPAICVALYVASGKRLPRAALYGAIAVGLAAALVAVGTLDTSFPEYRAILSERAPNLERDGYFEMTAGFKENIEYTRPLYSRPIGLIATIPAFVYWGLLVFLFFPLNGGWLLKLGFVGASASPLVMLVLGSDYYRWISLAAVAAIGLGGFLSAHGSNSRFSKRPWLAAALTLPWILLGPFGSACDPEAEPVGCGRVFPMAQFALERILPGT